MSLLCNCPLGAALNDIPIHECPETLGQVQKVIFQRLFDDGVKNTIADIKLLASWTPLLTAVNGTKVVPSPYIQAPNTEPGAALTYGGGNETLGGVPLVIGREPTPFTGNILRTSQDTIKALKSYQCENIGVYLVDEYGRIACIRTGTGEVGDLYEYSPVPISGFFVGDKNLGGREAPDMNAISWNFFPNWSDDLRIETPTDFNPLTDLTV